MLKKKIPYPVFKDVVPCSGFKKSIFFYIFRKYNILRLEIYLENIVEIFFENIVRLQKYFETYH